ncbi:phage head-tail connector protein [Miltoncostaea oceani]|uniref:phage head-tail connector protein n=1 Tax=Miltoncostaea oceani TaxID=2843216 RepID=UPI001C3D5F5F|nr:phage head-tail connector protein [Miltoncostaea oceani]
MIYARPGSTFEAVVNGYAAGLTTVRARILDNAGATISGPSTTGVTELVAGSGSYVATLTAPAVAGQYSVGWDTGVVSPATWTTEDLVVTSTPPSIAPAGPGLTTLARVKAQMEATSTTSDDLIEKLIPPASAAIERYTRTEFRGPDDPETRDVAFAPWSTRGRLELEVGAMREMPTAAVLLDADGLDLQTLTLPAELIALPVGRRPGVDPITTLRFASTVQPSLTGDEIVRVTGLWGWPAVPPDVEQACVITVRSWMRSAPAAAAGYGFEEGRVIQSTPEGGWMLPMAARQLLAPYRWPVVA